MSTRRVSAPGGALALRDIRERPAYQRLRELRSDADKLRNEF